LLLRKSKLYNHYHYVFSFAVTFFRITFQLTGVPALCGFRGNDVLVSVKIPTGIYPTLAIFQRQNISNLSFHVDRYVDFEISAAKAVLQMS
jgi:hypothetical protein